MKKLMITMFVACSSICAYAQSHTRSQVDSNVADNISACLHRQMDVFPESTLRDIYKNCFQGVFGPGHIIDRPESARQYLRQELEADTLPSPILYEYVGVGGNYVRVYLDVVKDGVVGEEELIDALVRSAALPVETTIEQWTQEWNEIETAVRTLYPDIPGLEEDSETIRHLLSSGKYVMHHSRHFNDVYRPHYRLIAKDVFEREILPKLSQKSER